MQSGRAVQILGAKELRPGIEWVYHHIIRMNQVGFRGVQLLELALDASLLHDSVRGVARLTGLWHGN
jgi:hypothetical protein